MYAQNFEYDGKLLSDFGFIIAKIDESNGVMEGDAGSSVTFVLSPVQAGKRFFVTGSTREDCLTTTFAICKDPSLFEGKEMNVRNDEFRALSRWLSRRKFCWFHAFDWCEPEKETPWFNATFMLRKIDYAGECVGVTLEMTTDSPFGFGKEEDVVLTFAAGDLTKVMVDKNDEVGECYPETIITCGASGTLTLTDDVTGCITQIENCTSGEVITLSGDTMIITSSKSAHDIANDFNYNFFKIGNTMSEKQNTITASMPCTVELKYRPIMKDTI